jgi:predicted NACHT family NTPase
LLGCVIPEGQEYFTARWFKEKADGDFSDLVCHVTDKQWREVFLLTVGMLQSGDKLVQQMKQEIDGMLAQDEKLQRFLGWVEEKSRSVEVRYKPAAVRAYYLALALALARALARALDLGSRELEKSLQQIKDRLPDTSPENRNNFNAWWKENGRVWTEELRAITIEHRNIGHDWQFSEEQEKLLQQYYDANMLLVDCLNSDCYVSREVREEIEGSLLLPIRG